MKKKLFMFVCSCALLTACSNSEKKSGDAENASVEVTDTQNAEASLNVEGTYKGVLPAADCPGIETTLTLNADNTFALHQVYIDQKDGTFDEKGTYTVEEDLLTLHLEGTDISYYYKVEENRLRGLDADKNEITGELAEHYVLNKE